MHFLEELRNMFCSPYPPPALFTQLAPTVIATRTKRSRPQLRISKNAFWPLRRPRLNADILFC